MNNAFTGARTDAVEDFPVAGTGICFVVLETAAPARSKEETRAIFELFSKQLKQLGLSLDHTVRTRMFTLDMESWSAANQERRRILSGKARSGELKPHLAAPRRSEGAGDGGSVGNVSAGIRRRQGSERIRFRNHRAAQNERGGLLFLSGVTDMTHVTFDEQFPVIINRLTTDTLTDGGGS